MVARCRLPAFRNVGRIPTHRLRAHLVRWRRPEPDRNRRAMDLPHRRRLNLRAWSPALPHARGTGRGTIDDHRRRRCRAPWPRRRSRRTSVPLLPLGDTRRTRHGPRPGRTASPARSHPRHSPSPAPRQPYGAKHSSCRDPHRRHTHRRRWRAHRNRRHGELRKLQRGYLRHYRRINPSPSQPRRYCPRRISE